jgi:hypothetical protein
MNDSFRREPGVLGMKKPATGSGDGLKRSDGP